MGRGGGLRCCGLLHTGSSGCVSRRFLGGGLSAMGGEGKGSAGQVECVYCVCLRGVAMALSIALYLCLCLSTQRDCRDAGDCGRDGDVRYMSKGGSNNKRGLPFLPLWMGWAGCTFEQRGTRGCCCTLFSLCMGDARAPAMCAGHGRGTRFCEGERPGLEAKVNHARADGRLTGQGGRASRWVGHGDAWRWDDVVIWGGWDNTGAWDGRVDWWVGTGTCTRARADATRRRVWRGLWTARHDEGIRRGRRASDKRQATSAGRGRTWVCKERAGSRLGGCGASTRA
jgi:hypothetical protein